MTPINSIKKNAQKAFNEDDYPSAFQILWDIGADHFVIYAGKESRNNKDKKLNWLTHPRSGDYFWNVFVIQPEVFSALLSSSSVSELLYDYFNKYDTYCQQFETKLAEEFPLQYVNAVRLSQVYLKPHRAQYLYKAALPQHLEIHQRTWKEINNYDAALWKEIEQEIQAVSRLPLPNIIAHLLIWLENSRFNQSDKGRLHHLADVYSFFMEMFFTTFPGKSNEDFGEEALLKILLDKAFHIDNVTPEEAQIVYRNLNGISRWIKFKDTVISPYSFDLKVEPVKENELMLFTMSAESNYRWLVNGARYEMNELNYFTSAMHYVEYIEQAGHHKIAGKNPDDIAFNRNLSGLIHSTCFFLADMGISSFRFGEESIPVNTLLGPLLTYSYNRMVRYEHNLNEYSANAKEWKEAFLKQCQHIMATRQRMEPFILTTNQDFKELNERAVANLHDNYADCIFQIVSSGITKRSFKRFKTHYDVFRKPFLKIGDSYFCPVMFFANNFWFYAFAQEALTRKIDERTETKAMESFFAGKLETTGWKVKLLTEMEANRLDGDIDIFVEDEESLLFIQLKRTYFRLNLKDAYYESINTDKKAAQQLNAATAFLSCSNDIYTITKEPVRWIVSTSFEAIGDSVIGCKKVNYFDVLHALENADIKSVADLIAYIENDQYAKTCAATFYRQGIPAPLPVKIFETKQYRQPVFSEDNAATSVYNEWFNTALALDKVGKKEDALVLLKRCKDINSNDAELHGAIANVLADMGNYKLALSSFDEALNLAPNDPYISRNYAAALFECGEYYQALDLALSLQVKFPLLEDIPFLFSDNFKSCVDYLSREQIQLLQNKWNNLK